MVKADNEAIQIIIPEIVLSATSPTIDGPTGVYFEGAFNAYYEDSTIDGLQAVFKLKWLIPVHLDFKEDL